MADDPIEPLFAYPRRGPLFGPKEVFQTLADTGVPYPAAQARVKSYAKNGLIFVREKGKNTQPNRYEFSDLGAALILSALQDAGVQDREVLQSAQMAIYGWSPKGAERDATYKKGPGDMSFLHPIDRAIIGTSAKETWCFYLDIWRDGQTGERILDCDLLRWGDVKVGHRDVPITAYPVASIAIMLDQMLQPVIRRMMPQRREN